MPKSRRTQVKWDKRLVAETVTKVKAEELLEKILPDLQRQFHLYIQNYIDEKFSVIFDKEFRKIRKKYREEFKLKKKFFKEQMKKKMKINGCEWRSLTDD